MLTWVNGGSTAVSFQLAEDLAATSRVEYLLTPGDGDGLASRRVRLNGKGPLDVHSELAGMEVAGKVGLLQLRPESYGFVVLKGTRARACV